MAKNLLKSVGKNKGVIGSWAFLIGVVIAILIGLIGGSTNAYLAILLVVIGLVVGLLNVSDEETTPFLMSGVVLIIAGSLGGSSMAQLSNSILTAWIPNTLNALMMIFVPATIIVAIKNVFSLARN